MNLVVFIAALLVSLFLGCVIKFYTYKKLKSFDGFLGTYIKDMTNYELNIVSYLGDNLKK